MLVLVIANVTEMCSMKFMNYTCNKSNIFCVIILLLFVGYLDGGLAQGKLYNVTTS